ncbi:hypothetical protein [Spiroplasma apis]|uniref:Transmembrane protein n=1 Tax=Spiroplasma apis B31 TaxID=1276258 RepID=V5RIS7_SPIAP|nr:hypothetical protein [Spiroplasma apis]AHB36388.1 hypothetical protein SAPIS_v1c05430 [Spiroplasma apis B31]
MKNKINPKTFVFIKFLLTLSLILMYSIGLISLVYAIKTKNNDVLAFSEIYYKIQFTLYFLAILAGIIYFILRFYIHKLTKQKFTKNEKIYISMSCCFMIVVFLLGLAVILFKNLDPRTRLISTIVVIIVLFIFGVSISILETLSRLTEQHHINKTWYEEIKLKETVVNPMNKTKNIEEKVLDKKKVDNPFMENDN